MEMEEAIIKEEQLSAEEEEVAKEVNRFLAEPIKIEDWYKDFENNTNTDFGSASSKLIVDGYDLLSAIKQEKTEDDELSEPQPIEDGSTTSDPETMQCFETLRPLKEMESETRCHDVKNNEPIRSVNEDAAGNWRRLGWSITKVQLKDCSVVLQRYIEPEVMDYLPLSKSDLKRNHSRFSKYCFKDQRKKGEKSKRRFQCDKCEKRFEQMGNLKVHQRIHTGEKPVQCDLCEKRFSHIGLLKRHIMIHTGEKPFQCEVCKKSFSQVGHLKEHQRIHTGEKPFQCDVCKKSFSQIGHLNEHQRIHTGEKPFQCEVCKKSFLRRTHLKGHQKIHTGEKPFQCGMCEQRFSLKSNLDAHQRIHTGEKPFQCDVCKKRFQQTGYLKVHQRIH